VLVAPSRAVSTHRLQPLPFASRSREQALQSASDKLMLRSSLQLKKLVVGRAGSVDEQLAAEGEGAEFVLETEAFELEGGANRQEDMVALGSQCSGG
jgi:hypothetical protein